MKKVTKEEMRITLSNNLNKLLDEKKISRRQISDDLNINYPVVCDWVKARTYPSQHNLGKLAFYLGTTIEQLTSPNSAINEDGFFKYDITDSYKQAKERLQSLIYPLKNGLNPLLIMNGYQIKI